jgi:hypothetical protein
MKLSWSSIKIGLDRKSGRIGALDQFERLDERYVYVIETPEELPIGYPTGVSNICYIGSSGRASDKRSRIASHALGWVHKCLVLNPDLGEFQVSFSHPRRRGLRQAFKEVEGFLLAEFKEEFGSTPLFNKRNEPEKYNFDIEINSKIFRHSSSDPKLRAISIQDEAALEE